MVEPNDHGRRYHGLISILCITCCCICRSSCPVMAKRTADLQFWGPEHRFTDVLMGLSGAQHVFSTRYSACLSHGAM